MILYDKREMNDISVVGGKGLGLAKLVNYGCEVPDFFVITVGTAFDDEFETELMRSAAKLQCDLFCVRSSSISEDGAEGSFAGQYLTIPNVGKKDLLDAIGKVAGSVNASTAELYSRHFCVHPCEMAIIVQKQITGKYSGVLFTRSFSSDEEMVIESVEGSGEKLVSGRVIPSKVVVRKDVSHMDAPYGVELVRGAIALEKAEGRPLDIEWTYSDKLYFLQMRPITVYGDVLPEIPKRNWNFYVYRDFCPLVHSVQARASEREIQERLFGFSVPIVEGILANGREFYSEENDHAVLQIWKELDRDDFFERFIKKIKMLVRRTKRYTERIREVSCEGLTATQLFSFSRKAIEKYIESYVPLMMRPDDYLLTIMQSVVGNEEKNFLDILTPVWKRTFYSDEKTEFLRAKIGNDADAYLKKYEWTCAPLGKAVVHLTKESVERRFCRLTVQQAEESLCRITAEKKERRRAFSSLLKAKDLPSERRRLFLLISEFIYLRTYTAENSDRLFFYIRENILPAIEKQTGVPLSELLHMTYKEIAAMERGCRLDRGTIAKRKSGELILFSNGSHCTYYGSPVGSLLAELMPYEGMGETVLSGDVACSGETCGRVCVVRDFSETEKAKEGDIIVTSMTTPELVAALEKASGIITDEGGITCHAAILSREFGVPCLVGTKFATRALHDGMNIRLDCIHGKVEKLPNDVPEETSD